MYSAHVRLADRAELIQELRQEAADRRRHGKLERADNADNAATQLEAGADAAVYNRVTYAVGEPDRYTVRRGARDAILAELRDFAIGLHHNGKAARASEAVAAFELIESGADGVRIGHLWYEVV